MNLMAPPLTTKDRFASLTCLLVAVLLVLTPILHVHPLLPGHGDRGTLASIGESALCVLCASGTNATIAPAHVPPAVRSEWTTLVAPPAVPSSFDRDCYSSRGPPLS